MPMLVDYDGSRRSVLLFADSPYAEMRVAELAEASGARFLRAHPIATAVQVLDEQPSFDAVVVEVAEDHGDALDRLLDRLETAARQGQHASVVSVPPELIDLAAARAPHPDVFLLCQANDADRSAALAQALACAGPVASRLNERKDEPLRLRQLSEEVGRIARTLASLSDVGEPLPAFVAPGEVPEVAGRAAAAPLNPATLRMAIRARRLRAHFFDADLFADPAWDMLLDLMAARLERRQVAVSSLCIAAAVPATTALRWIKALTTSGLFVRIADPRDGRRVFIELSAAAADGMAAYFGAVERLGIAFE